MTLSISDCTYSYPWRPPVLNGLSLKFEDGRNVLLGPNGAGKSTLLALCASVLVPRTGRIEASGRLVARGSTLKRYRRSVAWLPQTVSRFPGLTVRDHVAYVGWLKGMSARQARERTRGALELVDLGSLSDRPTSQLSGGQLRRLGLASALVHDAKVILLDEPTAGLDINQRDRLRDVLTRIPPNVCLVVSTHQVEDLSEVFNSVTVLDRGIVVHQSPVQDFVALSGNPARGAAAAYASLIQNEV